MSYRLRNLRFSYDGASDQLAVDSLDIRRGAVNVLYGDNGSGKTTLLKCLAGLLPLADTRGPEGEDLRIIKADSVYLHQHPYLLRGSVEANLKLALPGRAADLRKKIDEALELVGLIHKKHVNVRALSGGERKRAAIARGLLTNRSIMLFDEPAAHLDAATRHSLEELILRLADEGRTLIVTTHIREFGYRIGDQTLTLQNGKLEPSSANIYRGEYRRTHEGGARFTSNGVSLTVPDIEGAFRTAVLDYDDIILTTNHPSSSARNLIDGSVTAVRPAARGILVDVDAGIPITARITGISLEEMELEPGSPVRVLFKASSVRLF